MEKRKRDQEIKDAEYKKKFALDYSENIYEELNMINLQSVYQRSLFELQELRLFFNIPPKKDEFEKRRDRLYQLILHD